MPEDITLIRFQQLIDAYGTTSSRWPAEHRTSMLLLMDKNDAAKAYLNDNVELDILLDQVKTPDSAHLQLQFINGYPTLSTLDKMLNWLFPQKGRFAWTHSLSAASLVLIIGITIGTNTDLALSQDYSDNWDDEMNLLALQEEVEQSS